jgi:acetoin utilization deacetylase AcuC-like enzyme
MLKIGWNSLYAHPLPQGHRFPMVKYNLIPEQLLYEGTIKEDNIHQPGFLDEEIILLVHDKSYWHRLQEGNLTANEVRKTGFPWSQLLVKREISIAQGTLDLSLHALQYGIGLNVAGGTHHAYSDRGEGFCLLNDFALTGFYLLRANLAKQILIVDLDVHQGNGSAKIFENEPRVFTFSMHGANNYPLHKEQSDMDIALPDGIGDDEYLKILSNQLPKLIDRIQPDIIFYQSGVDVLATDKLGRLGLTIAGCKNRDKFVLHTCWQNNIPIVVSMGGGYSEKLADIVEAHANTFRLAADIFF